MNIPVFPETKVALKGKKGLVVGIANDQSIAWGCAKAFRALGADLAVTYLNEKARKHVEPLAKALEAPKPMSSISTITTFGAPSGAVTATRTSRVRSEPMSITGLPSRVRSMPTASPRPTPRPSSTFACCPASGRCGSWRSTMYRRTANCCRCCWWA